MSGGILDGVDQRTQLVGKNRLELLLFRLGGEQIYGINVFKVREVLPCPKLISLPKAHPAVKGVAHIRGGTISILDLNYAIQRPPIQDTSKSFVIITEYNMSTQGFLVNSVERIINMNWEEIKPPPRSFGKEHYLTAVTHVEDKLIEIIDVEKILAEISPRSEEISEGILDADIGESARELHVLTCDDSSVARKQVGRLLEKIGVQVTSFSDGKQTIEHLRELADQDVDVCKKYVMLVSDIEMPEMDGYTLTAAIRKDPRMDGMYIILHTSLSGVFNQAMVQKVGANDFLAKFKPDDLAARVQNRIKQLGLEIAET